MSVSSKTKSPAYTRAVKALKKATGAHTCVILAVTEKGVTSCGFEPDIEKVGMTDVLRMRAAFDQQFPLLMLASMQVSGKPASERKRLAMVCESELSKAQSKSAKRS